MLHKSAITVGADLRICLNKVGEHIGSPLRHQIRQ